MNRVIFSSVIVICLDLACSRKTGTTIEFLVDDSIFEVTKYEFNILKKRFKEVAYLNPIISITLEDEAAKLKEVYHFEGGIKQFVADLNKDGLLEILLWHRQYYSSLLTDTNNIGFVLEKQWFTYYVVVSVYIVTFIS